MKPYQNKPVARLNSSFGKGKEDQKKPNSNKDCNLHHQKKY